MSEVYDVIILGSGPAGLTAGIYAKRAGMKVAVVEKATPGGQVTTTYEVCNYPGFEKISGIDLATKMFTQASNIGVDILFEEVKDTILEGDIKQVITYNGTYQAKTVIICLGAAARRLNLDNERNYIGKGISYCATCDGTLFKDKVVAVVGGGNTAIEDAIYLSNLAKKVYLIHRRDQFRAETILSQSLQKQPNIEYVLNSVVTAISGDSIIRKVTVSNLQDKTQKDIELDGLFVAIGRGPDTDIVHGVKLDDKGYIIVDEKMQTSITGVYACGDIRNTQLRQIVTACSDGAIAATKAYEYISTHR